MKKYIIDRFEDEYAVCEDQDTEDMIDILIEKLPEDVEEGDVIVEENDTFYIDHEETELRRKQMAELLNSLLNKNNNKDDTAAQEQDEEDQDDFDDELEENENNDEGEEDARVDEGTETSN